MSHKIKLNLPDSPAKTRERNGKEEVWDSIRHKWLVLTPEEWVRQQMIGFLTGHKGADPMLVRQEQCLTLHGTSRRADIVIYDNSAAPQMVVECKAPQVGLTREVLEQAVRYNMILRVPYILITNGLAHYCFRVNETGNHFEALSEIPDFRK